MDKPSFERRSIVGILGVAAISTGAGADSPVSVNSSQASRLSVTPDEFGAFGDAQHRANGWTGRDDGPAINRAIAWLKQQGGGDLIIHRTHFIGSRSGAAPLAAGDDASTVSRSLDYAIGIPFGVRVYFRAQGSFVTNASTSYGLRPLACLALLSPENQAVVVNGGVIEGFFAGIISVGPTTVCARFENIVFRTCALGIFARTLEQCRFNNIVFQNCGCGIVIGGFWANSNNVYNEQGGFSDKCVFSNIRSVSGWALDGRANDVDSWFDDLVFMSRNTLLATDLPNGVSPATAFKYRGVVGYAVLMMARYSRPNNSNYFDLLSHALAARSAIRIDASRGNMACSIYTETVGYADAAKKVAPIGSVGTDPYLGHGMRLPALVAGVGCIDVLNAQSSIANRPSDARFIKLAELSSSDFDHID